MKRIRNLVLIALFGTAFLAVATYSQSQPRENVRVFMRAKLEHSQKVLEGLTIEDFELISKSAAQMELLSQDAAWQVLQTPEYRQQSLEFRRAAETLKEAADKKNLEGAALSYVDVTLKCVKCHQYVSETRNASDYGSF